MAQSEGIKCLQFSDMIIGSLKWSSAVVKLKLLYYLQGNRVKTNGDLYHSTIWRSQESPIRPLTDDHLYQALNLHLTYALHLTIISPRLRVVQFSCKVLHSLCYEGELWKKKSYCTVFPYNSLFCLTVSYKKNAKKEQSCLIHNNNIFKVHHCTTKLTELRPQLSIYQNHKFFYLHLSEVDTLLCLIYLHI